MLNVDQKKKVIKKYKAHKNDTGSSQVQIALVTEKIKYLTKHLTQHKKDVHSRRGLLKMVQKRKDLLDYLKKQNEAAYEDIKKKLNLKHDKKDAKVEPKEKETK
jgi:small subunit ribosomal protein S15